MHVHDMSHERKTAANLLVKMKAEFTYLKSELGLVPIGVVGDASGDERRCRLEFGRENPWALLAECWGHQVKCHPIACWWEDTQCAI
jgi:hypothetical protein